jgi:hypothetical protein
VEFRAFAYRSGCTRPDLSPHGGHRSLEEAGERKPAKEPRGAMLGLFERVTRDDPQFGLLVRKKTWSALVHLADFLEIPGAGAWTGTLRTPLFPETALRISVKARDEVELTTLRRHLAQIVAHAEQIRSQIAHEAFETYRLYREEEGEAKAYADITLPDAIWPLIKPVKWEFALGSSHHKSRVEIKFGWPNPHYLGAYLDDTALYALEVEG